MTFCNLPDSLDLGGENANVDPDMLAEMRKTEKIVDGIQHPNPGKPGDVKRATGPKIVEVIKYKEATPQMKKIWSETNSVSRDILFHCLDVVDQKTPHLKRFRENMEKSESLRDLLGYRLSFANYNDYTQCGTLMLSAYLKSLIPINGPDLHLQEPGPPRKRQHVLPSELPH